VGEWKGRGKLLDNLPGTMPGKGRTGAKKSPAFAKDTAARRSGVKLIFDLRLLTSVIDDFNDWNDLNGFNGLMLCKKSDPK
jgi:hypothetical protein